TRKENVMISSIAAIELGFIGDVVIHAGHTKIGVLRVAASGILRRGKIHQLQPGISGIRADSDVGSELAFRIKEGLSIGGGGGQECRTGNQSLIIELAAHPDPLGALEKEKFVLHNRAADGIAELVTHKMVSRLAGGHVLV